MAEELNQNILPPQESEAIASPDNTGDDNEKIAKQNRINLYNTILGLKEKGFSDVYKNAGFAKFERNLLDNQEFQDALLYDLQTRGFQIDPGSFYGGLTNVKAGYVYQEPPPPTAPEVGKLKEEAPKKVGFFEDIFTNPLNPLTYITKAVKSYAKDLYTQAVRGGYTGAGNRSIQWNYDPDNIDTKNLAKQIHNINQLDASSVEQEFLKDEGWGKDFLDLIAYTPPAIVESLSSMFVGSGDKVASTTLGYASMGAAAGAAGGPLAEITSPVGAAIMGTRGLQVGMTEAGFNMEFSGKLLEEMQKEKMYDPTAPEDIIEKQLNIAFKNKKAMEPIIKKASTKAGIISGGTAAITFGMGNAIGSVLSSAESRAATMLAKTPVGQILSSGAKIIKSSTPAIATARVATRVAAVADKLKASSPAVVVTAMQPAGMAVAGATEALSQYVVDGKINWKDVAIETTADGAYLNMLSKLSDIGVKQEAQSDKGKTDAEIQAESVKPITQEEFDNYRKGQIEPTLAAKIMDDLNIAATDATHLNKVAAIDPLYGQLLTDEFQKFTKQVEIQNLRETAYADLAELNGLTVDQVKDFVNPQSASFNQDLADNFETTVESLTRQWEQENDSQNQTGASGAVGGGQESQQAQSDEEASDEEAGDDRILEDAVKQERLAEIQDLLDQDEKYFAKNNERLLDDAERTDLQDELTRIQAELEESKAKQLTPEQQKDKRIEEAQKKSGYAYSSPLSALTNEGKSILQSIEQGKYINLAPVKELYDEIYKAYKVFSNQRQSTTRNLTTGQIDQGVTEMESALNKLGDYISKRDNGQFVREYTGRSGSTATVAPTTTTPQVGSTATAAQAQTGDGVVATTETAPATTTTPLTTTEASTEERPAAETQLAEEETAVPETQETTKQSVKESDVKIKKGKDFQSDGVYELVVDGKVIGRMYYDRSMHNQWIDADYTLSRGSDPTGLIGSNKKEAVAALVAQYNAKQNIEVEAETKTEGKTEDKKQGKKEKKQETKPEGKTEDKKQGKKEKKQETKPESKEQTTKSEKEKKPETAAAQETIVEAQEATEKQETPAPGKLPSFAQFDAITENRANMQEARAAFIAEHGQAAYNAMKEITANFTKITKALQAKEILTKQC